MAEKTAETDLKTLPLDALHRDLGARMVPFAGWEMPLHYTAGILKEHLHTRDAASLFDISHMAPMLVNHPAGGMNEIAARLEQVMPIDVHGLAEGRQRYGFLTNERGGIIDDLMIANRGDHFYIVLNAAQADTLTWELAGRLQPIMAGPLRGRAMLALQGPKAGEIMARIAPDSADMVFLDCREIWVMDVMCLVSRAGYTGEDGFEISIPEDYAEHIARTILDHPDARPAGLGARDSLRLEAGLCLHGNDIDADTSPVEAGLTWAIQKVRRRGGDREGGFPGAERILAEIEDGPLRRLVGLRPEGRAPVRAGAVLRSTDGAEIGRVTSGVFGPSVGGPVAMGYVAASHAEAGTAVQAEVRGKALPVTVTKLPFIKTGYKR